MYGGNSMQDFDVYKDIAERTSGEIYIGVVGPVRTGKSTFIKRFMDVLVLPKMENPHELERTKDELPQSAAGKTIMTTEPKFIPKEAAQISLTDEVSVKMRLIDVVGFVIEGASGHIEGGVERMVKTPWMEGEIPFTQAATIGTKKVIHDHATIGIVVTTDGSIGDIERSNYLEAEKKTIQELQAIGKPFIVLVNSQKPYGEEAQKIAANIKAECGVETMAVNCAQLKEADINKIMQSILYEFPITEVQFLVPKWVEMLNREHAVKKDILEYVRAIIHNASDVKTMLNETFQTDSPYIDEIKLEKVYMDSGCIQISISMKEECYYHMLSELTGTKLDSEYDLIGELKQLATLKNEYQQVEGALNMVRMKGYGVVMPNKNEITVKEPEIIKQGNKYGVKIHSIAPSIHFIRANIETEIAPIVGSEAQAQDLVKYIKENTQKEDGIWNTNIFGKSVEELVEDGMKNKVTMITDESQVKLQDTMQKIVNDSNGGLVCIII